MLLTSFEGADFPREINMKNQKGFTLIELLLVLAIIGIISAIAIPALLGQRERAKAKAVQGNLDAVAGECARVNDQIKELGTAVTATQVVASVLALTNYMLPVAVNPYAGSGNPAYASTGTTNGTVVLVGGLVTDVTGQQYSGVTITGYFLQGNAAQSKVKIVALD